MQDTFPVTMTEGDNSFSGTLTVSFSRVETWWPRGYGDQPLYKSFLNELTTVSMRISLPMNLVKLLTFHARLVSEQLR